MTIRIFTAATMLLLGTSLAQAAPFNADAIGKQYQDDGYSRVEIKIRQTQAKVEAIKGGRELELVYDLKTGKVLDREWDDLDDDDSRRPGVFIRHEDRYGFVRVGKRHDDDGHRGRHHHSGDDDHYDDDRHDDDRYDDDHDDDSHRGRGRGGRDDD